MDFALAYTGNYSYKVNLKDFIKNMDTLKLDNKIARLPGRNMWRINERSRNDVDSGTQAADLLSKVFRHQVFNISFLCRNIY